jgi:protease IV
MKKHVFLLAGLIIVLLSGCAFVNVPLYTPAQPLREKVIEGEGRTKILLIDISGFISEAEKSRGSILAEEVPLLSRVKEELQKAEQDKAVSGLIIKINSPGGTVAASDTIHHEILEFKKRTGVRVTASIMGLGTSGAYYVASAADEIIAVPTAVTGSIGVIAMRFDVRDLMTKIGVGTETVKSGDKKDIWSPFRPSTPEETKIMQNIIDQLYNRFIDAVALGRKDVLSRAEILKLADGRIYTADQALGAKLIDRIGYLGDAVAATKNFLKVSEASVIVYHRPGAYRGTIYSGTPVPGPQVVNLININGDSLSLLPEVKFLYLWKP